MDNTKQERSLEIFFRGLRGEDISVRRLSEEYGVSTKSVTRSINDLKNFLADHRDLVGNTELVYFHRDKCYRLRMDEFLSGSELFALVEVLIGARAFSKIELLSLVDKLKRFVSTGDRSRLSKLVSKELYHYSEIRHDCDSVQGMLWDLVGLIADKKEITVDYYRMDRSFVTHRLLPASVMFTDYYFYLIAFRVGDEERQPNYFRVDRIKKITVHRERLLTDDLNFDEGELRKRSLLMWPGRLRTIRFEFTGPSVQAVLDKLPTAKIIDRRPNGVFLIEAETYGDGVKMWLLSQGSWVKVVSPDELADEMKKEAMSILEHYTGSR